MIATTGASGSVRATRTTECRIIAYKFKEEKNFKCAVVNYLEKNKNTRSENVCNVAKALVRGKFI